jgi:hypothetical protein
VAVGAGPEAEQDSLLVAFARVVSESDVELGLDGRVVRPVPPCEPKERFVAGVVPEGIRQSVTRGDVDPQASKPLIQLGVVGIQESVQAHLSGIGAPVEKQVEKVSLPRPQDRVERALQLRGQVVAVGNEKEDQRVIASIEGNPKGTLVAPGPVCRPLRRELQGTAVLDPTLDVVQAPVAAVPMQLQ